MLVFHSWWWLDLCAVGCYFARHEGKFTHRVTREWLVGKFTGFTVENFNSRCSSQVEKRYWLNLRFARWVPCIYIYRDWGLQLKTILDMYNEKRLFITIAPQGLDPIFLMENVFVFCWLWRKIWGAFLDALSKTFWDCLLSSHYHDTVDGWNPASPGM